MRTTKDGTHGTKGHSAHTNYPKRKKSAIDNAHFLRFQKKKKTHIKKIKGYMVTADTYYTSPPSVYLFA